MNLGFYCCESFEDQITWSCEIHQDPIDCPDASIVKYKSGNYGIPIRDGGSSYYTIYYCPWCGKKLIDNVFDEKDLEIEDD